MDNGWQASADAWIAGMGEHGDFARRYVPRPGHASTRLHAVAQENAGRWLRGRPLLPHAQAA